MFPPCLSGRGDVELLQEVVGDEDGDDDADEDGLGVADGDQGAGDDQGLEQRTRSRKIYFLKNILLHLVDESPQIDRDCYVHDVNVL